MGPVVLLVLIAFKFKWLWTRRRVAWKSKVSLSRTSRSLLATLVEVLLSL